MLLVICIDWVNYLPCILCAYLKYCTLYHVCCIDFREKSNTGYYTPFNDYTFSIEIPAVAGKWWNMLIFNVMSLKDSGQSHESICCSWASRSLRQPMPTSKKLNKCCANTRNTLAPRAWLLASTEKNGRIPTCTHLHLSPQGWLVTSTSYRFFWGRTGGALLAANMHRSSLSAHPCGVDHLPWPSILAHKNRWGQKHQNMFHPSILPLSPQYIHHVVQLPLNWHTLGSKTWWGWQRNHTICTSMIRTERWAVFKLGIDYSNKLTMTKEDQVLLIVTVHKTC